LILQDNKVMKQLKDKEALKVRTNIEGTPVAIINNMRPENIVRIYDKWCNEEGNDSQRRRNYFKVRTNRGIIYDIYREEISKQWYIGKTYG